MKPLTVDCQQFVAAKELECIYKNVGLHDPVPVINRLHKTTVQFKTFYTSRADRVRFYYRYEIFLYILYRPS